MKYRDNTAVVDAFQLDERGLVAEDWFWDAVTDNKIITHNFGKMDHSGEGPAWCEIKTKEGIKLEAQAGDYIIRDRKGEIFSMYADKFEIFYERRDASAAECCSVPTKGVSVPFDVYDSQEQLDASLKEWQHRLYLDGWMIKARIVGAITDMGTGEDVENAVGFNTVEPLVCQAYIQILSKTAHDVMNPLVERICMEKTLVHELLHCLYCWMEAPDSFEGVYYTAKEHQQLEQMAKSLIMAKYRIDYDYFWRKS